jgi:ribosomal protein S8
MTKQNLLIQFNAKLKQGLKKKKKNITFRYLTSIRLFLDLLTVEGLIYTYNLKSTQIFLKYTHTGKTLINSVKILSKPSHNRYISLFQLKSLLYLSNSNEVYILSTNLGLLTADNALKFQVGGKLICKLEL